MTCPAGAIDRKSFNIKLPRRYFAKEADDNGFNSKKITELAGGEADILVPMDVDDDGRMDILV